MCDLHIRQCRDLQIPFFSLDEPDRLPHQLQQLHIIRDLIERQRAGVKRIQQIPASHGLRSLHRPELVPSQRLLHRRGQRADRLFDREMNWQSGRGGAVEQRGFKTAGDQFLGNQRPGRIVNGDPLN